MPRASCCSIEASDIWGNTGTDPYAVSAQSPEHAHADLKALVLLHESHLLGHVCRLLELALRRLDVSLDFQDLLAQWL